MKKVLNRLNVTLNIVVWIIIIILGELYYGIILLVELILSHLIWAIEWIVKGSIKFFCRSYKSLQKFTLEILNSIIHR